MVQEGSRRFKRVQKGYRGYTEYGILLGPSKTRWKGPKCIQVGSKIVQSDLSGPKSILFGTKSFQISISGVGMWGSTQGSVMVLKGVKEGS